MFLRGGVAGEVGVAAALLGAIAQPGGQHQGTLQVQTQVVFVGDANGAVQLHRFACHLQPGVLRARLDAAGHGRARCGIAVLSIEQGHRLRHHAGGQFLLDQQVDGAVL